MNYFKCINEVKPSYIVDTEPVFSETVLYENQTSAAENTITLSEDYHNFDIIKFNCYSTNYGNSSYFATPDMLDHMKADNPYINLNAINTIHYITYQINSNTQLTCSAQRVLYITKIIGLNCSNGTLVETEIYSRTKANTWVTIETELNLFEFDMILAQTTTGNWDECNINDTIFLRSNSKYLGSSNIKNQLNQWRVSYYSDSHVIGLTEHTMSSGRWYYVAGLKFIPNWDYYIENRTLTGSDYINTGLLPWKDDNTKARSWEMCFKIETTSENSNGGYVTTGNNLTPGVWLTRNGGNNSYKFMLDDSCIYNNSLSNKDVKIVCNHEDTSNPYIVLYVNGEKVCQKTENLSEYNTNRPVLIGIYSPYLGYYITGTIHYFGFRWLS